MRPQSSGAGNPAGNFDAAAWIESAPPAAERLLTTFFLTGAADASSYRTLVMDFTPVVRLSLLAKVLPCTLLLPAAALAVAIRRRRRA